jgi:hypothetical protein
MILKQQMQELKKQVCLAEKMTFYSW